jgi:predicted TPR repeat methyltransferase
VNFLKQGDAALDNKQYNRAADAYNEALKIKPNDVAAHDKLAQIEKSKAQDKINDTYISYMNAGDKATGNKSYDEARDFL